jgi:hypothetical protein
LNHKDYRGHKAHTTPQIMFWFLTKSRPQNRPKY